MTESAAPNWTAAHPGFCSTAMAVCGPVLWGMVCAACRTRIESAASGSLVPVRGRNSSRLKTDCPAPQVFAIMEDREGNIWCGTQNGLDRFRPGAFLAVDVQSPDLRLSASPRKTGISGRLRTIRVTWSASVHVGRRAGQRKSWVQSSQQMRSARTMAAAFGSSTQAIFPCTGFDRAALPVFHCRPASDSKTSATSHATTSAAFGYSMFSGAFSDMTDRGPVKVTDSSDPDYVSPVLSVDSRDRVWLGGRDSIEMFDHGSRRRFGASDGLTVKSIRVFAEDKAGNVWVGGQGGLVKFDHGRFRSLSRSNGLPAQSVSGLTEDDAGSWWIACDAGVLRIRAEELEHALRDPAYHASYELFDLLDGLPARPVVQPMPVLTKRPMAASGSQPGTESPTWIRAGFQGTRWFRRCASKA